MGPLEMLPHSQHPPRAQESGDAPPSPVSPQNARTDPERHKAAPQGCTGELSALGGSTAPSTTLVARGFPTAKCDHGKNASNRSPAGPRPRRREEESSRTEGSEAFLDVRIYHIFVCVTIHR